MSTIWEAAAVGDVSFLEMHLQESPQEVDLKNYFGETALMIAASNNKAAAVKCLLSFKADVHEADKESKWTPLHRACDRGCLTVCSILIQAGASVTKIDYDLNFPLDLLSLRAAQAIGAPGQASHGRVHSCSNFSHEWKGQGDSSPRFSAQQRRPDQEEPESENQLTQSQKSLQASRFSHVIYSCGNPTNDQLGFAANTFHVKPRQIQFPSTQTKRMHHNSSLAIASLFCSGSVGEGGELYTWGRGMGGQLGHGTVATEIEPRRVEGVCTGKKFVALTFASVGNFASAVTDAGAVYVWGQLSNCQGSAQENEGVSTLVSPFISRSYSSCSTPAPTRALYAAPTSSFSPPRLLWTGCPVAHVVAAPDRMYFLTKAGSLLMIGSRPQDGKVEKVPREVSALKPLQRKIIQVCANCHCTVILTQAGEVLLQGKGQRSFHKIALPRKIFAVKIAIPDSTLMPVASKLPQRGLVLDSQGSVFWWPLPSLATSENNLGSQARRVLGLQHTLVVEIATAATHALYVTKNGCVYVHGPSQHCLSTDASVAASKIRMGAPRRINRVSQVVGVSTAEKHTMFRSRIRVPSPPGANHLFMPSLQMLAENALCKQIDSSNCVPAFGMAHTHGWKIVMEYCARFILMNACLLLPFFWKLSSEFVCNALEQFYRNWYPITHTSLPTNFSDQPLDKFCHDETASSQHEPPSAGSEEKSPEKDNDEELRSNPRRCKAVLRGVVKKLSQIDKLVAKQQEGMKPLEQHELKKITKKDELTARAHLLRSWLDSLQMDQDETAAAEATPEKDETPHKSRKIELDELMQSYQLLKPAQGKKKRPPKSQSSSLPSSPEFQQPVPSRKGWNRSPPPPHPNFSSLASIMHEETQQRRPAVGLPASKPRRFSGKKTKQTLSEFKIPSSPFSAWGTPPITPTLTFGGSPLAQSPKTATPLSSPKLSFAVIQSSQQQKSLQNAPLPGRVAHISRRARKTMKMVDFPASEPRNAGIWGGSEGNVKPLGLFEVMKQQQSQTELTELHKKSAPPGSFWRTHNVSPPGAARFTCNKKSTKESPHKLNLAEIQMQELAEIQMREMQMQEARRLQNLQKKEMAAKQSKEQIRLREKSKASSQKGLKNNPKESNINKGVSSAPIVKDGTKERKRKRCPRKKNADNSTCNKPRPKRCTLNRSKARHQKRSPSSADNNTSRPRPKEKTPPPTEADVTSKKPRQEKAQPDKSTRGQTLTQSRGANCQCSSGGME